MVVEKPVDLVQSLNLSRCVIEAGEIVKNVWFFKKTSTFFLLLLLPYNATRGGDVVVCDFCKSALVTNPAQIGSPFVRSERDG